MTRFDWVCALQNKLVPKAPKPIELFFKERVK